MRTCLQEQAQLGPLPVAQPQPELQQLQQRQAAETGPQEVVAADLERERNFFTEMGVGGYFFCLMR